MLILWGLLACPDEFGNFGMRYASFLDLLSIDRVGTFIVNLVIFTAFQGWFVNNDMMQREVGSTELLLLWNAAKFAPFFGSWRT